MIGWRRKAKAARENTLSAERLYDLVNQTLLSNFGPLGSYAITRREPTDCDDIFHTMLASSVAHNIVTSLIEHKAVVVSTALPLAPLDVAAGPLGPMAETAGIGKAPVSAATIGEPAAAGVLPPLPAAIAEVLSSGDRATAAVAELAAAELEQAGHPKVTADVA